MALRVVALAVALAAPAAAQFDNPVEKIRELAHEIAEQLQEIDRLLLEAPRTGNAQQGMAEAAQRMQELLESTTNSQDLVVKKIDALIDQLLDTQQQQQQRSGGGGGSGSPQPRESERQGRNQRSQRAESEQMENERRGERDQEARAQPQDPGRNEPAGAEPKDPTERVERAADNERWGELQGYDDLIKSRGGAPQVPDKYRRYHEAFLRRGNDPTGGAAGGRGGR